MAKRVTPAMPARWYAYWLDRNVAEVEWDGKTAWPVIRLSGYLHSPPMAHELATFQERAIREVEWASIYDECRHRCVTEPEYYRGLLDGRVRLWCPRCGHRWIVVLQVGPVLA